jgi:pimeloyl-ACP methyl ester carboxylesterase
LVVITALAVAEVALASSASQQPIVHFLSSTGTPLPTDWRPNPGALTFFVIHGFQARGTDAPSLRQAVVIEQRFLHAKALIVDYQVPSPVTPANNGATQNLWGELVDRVQQISANYDMAVKAAPEVGEEIAQWMKLKGVDPARTILCGHSLGAQIAGFAGRRAAGLFGQPLLAILAADPAGPGFRERPVGMRLSKNDAQQVIVIHTTKLVGDSHPIGTLDIYISWREANAPDELTAHSQAREFLTDFLLPPAMRSNNWNQLVIHTIGQLASN